MNPYLNSLAGFRGGFVSFFPADLPPAITRLLSIAIGGQRAGSFAGKEEAEPGAARRGNPMMVTVGRMMNR